MPTLMRRETPAVAKYSSSRSKEMEHSMSAECSMSPYCSVAFTCKQHSQPDQDARIYQRARSQSYPLPKKKGGKASKSTTITFYHEEGKSRWDDDTRQRLRALCSARSPKHDIIFHVQNTLYTTVYLDLLHYEVQMNS